MKLTTATAVREILKWHSPGVLDQFLGEWVGCRASTWLTRPNNHDARSPSSRLDMVGADRVNRVKCCVSPSFTRFGVSCRGGRGRRGRIWNAVNRHFRRLRRSRPKEGRIMSEEATCRFPNHPAGKLPLHRFIQAGKVLGDDRVLLSCTCWSFRMGRLTRCALSSFLLNPLRPFPG